MGDSGACDILLVGMTSLMISLIGQIHRVERSKFSACLKNGRTTKSEGKGKHDVKKAGVREGILVLSHFS